MNWRYQSVWDALIDDPEEANDLKKRSDYLILIQARLNSQSGNDADKAERFGLLAGQMRDLAAGKIDKLSLPEIVSIARKIGITAKV